MGASAWELVQVLCMEWIEGVKPVLGAGAWELVRGS